MCKTISRSDSTAGLSAEKLHELLVTTHVVGNVARRKFIQVLYALHVSRLYFKLGYSSVVQYAEKHFKYRRTQVFEFLRVAEVLKDLPECIKAFDKGAISWSVLKEITRVATAETEGEWLEFSNKNSVARLYAEIKDALNKGRKVPRKAGFGLPSTPVRLVFELNPEDHDLVTKALKKTASEMGKSLNGKSIEPMEALLYMARKILETEPDKGVVSNRVEREDSI